ncbi:DUF3486 family protein [Roseibium sp. CAU 1637]|uniref:DUF3486 family protein n=1 Tax=Roseibium limicola TaxID=2816037 RepID=A0A939J9L4_9HYPH|nr:DUF3486 family protein [Roseibium limicola]MBO0346029.1 DUF3486 family protein [Roseibium limicola]
MARRHKGRGRLSAIEQLPPECDDTIAWAANELRMRERTQTDIYQEFHGRLEAVLREQRGEIEFKIPSFSAFNRYSLKLAMLTRRLEETREIAGSIADKFDAEASDDLTLIAAEAVKTLVFELLTDAGESGIDPKGALNLAGALRAAAQAQGVSTQRRQKVEKDFADKATEAVETVARVKGLTAETAEAIKAQILGVQT